MAPVKAQRAFRRHLEGFLCTELVFVAKLRTAKGPQNESVGLNNFDKTSRK